MPGGIDVELSVQRGELLRYASDTGCMSGGLVLRRRLNCSDGLRSGRILSGVFFLASVVCGGELLLHACNAG